MRAFAVFVASLLLIACPGNRRGEHESQNAPTKRSTATVNPQAVPERSKRMNPITPPNTEISGPHVTPAATQQVQVQLTEYEIRLPEKLSTGRHTFHVANAGKLNHNFAIAGNGIDKKLASDLAPGDTADMDFVLRKGTYKMYCPVDQHRGRGMERTVVVK
jgi:hypothetical protein